MKIIRESNEDEMILEFLKGELNSNRFNEQLNEVLKELNISKDIIENGNTKKNDENKTRKLIMFKFRGYPTEELFERFPTIYKWKLVKFEDGDIDKINYIDYDYWNELSNNTSKPIEAAKNINNGAEIFEVSNKPFLEGLKYLNKFPPVILITCNDEKFLIIEGHSRMTVYGLKPEAFKGTFGYIGYCKIEDMKKYDSRMI